MADGGDDVLDLHRLWLLRELKHLGTLAAVAETHAYSPSAISQQLKVLESEAGVPLLEPVGRRVRLTPAAERLVQHVEQILATLERATADLSAASTTIAGTVRVAGFQTAAHAIVPAAIGALECTYPQLRVEFSEQEPEVSLPGLVAREFDLVLVEEFPGQPQRRGTEVRYHELLADRLQLAQPAARRARPLGELADRPWIMEPDGTPARAWAVTTCREAGFEPDVRYEAADLMLHARMVAEGRAAAFLPRLMGLGRDRRIRITDLPGHPARRIHVAIRRGAGRNPALKVLREALAVAAQAA